MKGVREKAVMHSRAVEFCTRAPRLGGCNSHHKQYRFDICYGDFSCRCDKVSCSKKLSMLSQFSDIWK